MASINDLKKELQTKSPQDLAFLCLRLAKYKHENKELLDYALNYAQDETTFVEAKKAEITQLLADVAAHNYKNATKIVRKTLQTAKKYIKYSGIVQTELELLIHFCKTIKDENLKINRYSVMQNMYNKVVLKIEKLIQKLHPDLQFDYDSELENIRTLYTEYAY